MENTRRWIAPRAFVACIGTAVSVLLLLLAASAARADEIAYTCGYDICTIDPDHTETHADLTKTETVSEFEPVWSPDGTHIAFNGTYSAFDRIYTISVADPEAGVLEVADGSEVDGGEPAWSPDGSRIAFAGYSQHDQNDVNVYVSPASGTSAPQVIGHTTEEEKEPAWSPTGSLLAFAHGTSTWIAAPEESATAHLLTDGLGMKPAWSPDGTRIATVTAGEPHKVRLIDADGDGVASEEPTAAEQASTVAWSPDSSQIVYIDEADHVLVAPTDPPGPGVEVQLPPGYIVPLDPSFSPDGSRVAFDARESTGAQTDRIFVGPASGGEATAVTEGTVDAREPAWKPGPGGGGAGAGGPSGGSPGGGSSGGGANPPPTKPPVVLKLAAFRHPLVEAGFLGAAYIDCSLGSTNAACRADGEATYDAPITDSFDLARSHEAGSDAPIADSPDLTRSKAKPIVFAKGSVIVPAGKTLPLRLKITVAGMKLLKKRRSLKVTETVVETAPGAKAKTTRKTFTVKAPGKEKPGRSRR